MTDNVIALDDHRPHQSTYVACLVCGKDWVAVAPADVVHFECPGCRILCGVEVKPDSVEFLNSYFKEVRDKKETMRRTMVVLNAKRMIEESQ